MRGQVEAAKFFSDLFTPFGVAAVISIVFSWFSPTGIGPSMTPLSSALLGILTLSIGPFIPVLHSARSGRTDLDVSDVKKRVPLYGVGLTGYAVGTAVFFALDNRLMFVMALAYLCVSSTMLMITFVWKISAHTAGVAGPTTALFFVFGHLVLPLYLLSVVMVWSRIKLHAHTMSQAVAGLVVAITVTSLVFMAFYPPYTLWLLE